MEPVPSVEGPLPDDELDRLIAIKERLKLAGVPEKDLVLGVGDRPSCHIDKLYSEEAQELWKASQQHGPGLPSLPGRHPAEHEVRAWLCAGCTLLGARPLTAILTSMAASCQL